MTKYCYACRRTLPLEAFARHRGRGDGYQSSCRVCKSYEQRKRYARTHGYPWVEREQRMVRPWPPAPREG
jgi:hypothetical protein